MIYSMQYGHAAKARLTTIRLNMAHDHDDVDDQVIIQCAQDEFPQNARVLDIKSFMELITIIDRAHSTMGICGV